jgi:hypothetical protein
MWPSERRVVTKDGGKCHILYPFRNYNAHSGWGFQTACGRYVFEDEIQPKENNGDKDTCQHCMKAKAQADNYIAGI